MKAIRENALTLVLMLLFLISIIGQILAGWRHENEELLRHGEAAIGLLAYLGGGSFLSAVFENWESEFLQMTVYVVLTAHLLQRRSAESRDPGSPQDAEHEAEEEAALRRYAPGLRRFLHAHSLGVALGVLFALSFLLHWVNSARAGIEEAAQHGEPAPSTLGWIAEPEFWFQSFQNWQSEFLSTAVLVVLTIFLRERGSPESKLVGEPDAKTGKE